MTPPDRRVITFYSFKGGVGRTMAMANVAYRLANTHGLNVIAVDWDLEAPGLHRFFGITPEVAAKTRGTLDYFLAWGAAVKRNDPEPPPEEHEVVSWILPIEDEAHKPKFGSVSVLLAGKQDRTYDQRLSRFDWREFYADAAGAVAVEKLRNKLVERADVVLIDSRTGFTDAGGVCVIQIPDGVVLMTAPNEQSLEGTEQIARTISKASIDERAQRGRAKVWLVMARVPSVEESYLAQEWFKRKRVWFEKGIEEGLWLKEDHSDGIRSLEIPYAARWGFGEPVLSPVASSGPADPLVRAYEHLTETLLRWVRGESVMESRLRIEASVSATTPKDITELEGEATEAERRGDMLGLAITLMELADRLDGAGRRAEGISKLEQAVGIFLSRGAHHHRMLALGRLGTALAVERRTRESSDALTKSRELARELGNRRMEALLLMALATNEVEQGADAKAVHLFQEIDAIEQALGTSARFPPVIIRSVALYRSGRKEQAVTLLREGMNAARQKADATFERHVIGVLLELTAHDPLADADALRARLAELSPP